MGIEGNEGKKTEFEILSEVVHVLVLILFNWLKAGQGKY